jgi:alkylated DNA nucleotide flippase Atl1
MSMSFKTYKQIYAATGGTQTSFQVGAIIKNATYGQIRSWKAHGWIKVEKVEYVLTEKGFLGN